MRSIHKLTVAVVAAVAVMSTAGPADAFFGVRITSGTQSVEVQDGAPPSPPPPSNSTTPFDINGSSDGIQAVGGFTFTPMFSINPIVITVSGVGTFTVTAANANYSLVTPSTISMSTDFTVRFTAVGGFMGTASITLSTSRDLLSMTTNGLPVTMSNSLSGTSTGGASGSANFNSWANLGTLPGGTNMPANYPTTGGLTAGQIGGNFAPTSSFGTQISNGTAPLSSPFYLSTQLTINFTSSGTFGATSGTTLSVVPAPPALLLGLIGLPALGAALRLRRRTATPA